MEFFGNVDLTLDQVQHICRGLYQVAATDGVHPRETALIRDFYDACRNTTAPSYEDLVKQPFSIEDSLEVLGTPEVRRLFIKTCWLLAMADGKITGPEQGAIAAYAVRLGVPEAQSLELQAEVKEHLLAQLTHLKNTNLVAEIGRQMKLS
jgi:hypothetical protein